MTEKIRILVADDHAIVRTGISEWIDSESDLELFGEAADGAEAVEKALELKPDVILMDLVMPKKDGIEATKEIIRKEPDSSILLITGFSEKAHAIPAIQAGALGFILKDTSPEEMLRAIREVDRGNLWLSPEIKRMLMRKTASPKPSARFTDAPTERELDVLKLICLGNSDEDIAEELVISKATVRFHVTNILSKLQVKNRTQAALYAIKEGYCKV